MQNLAILTGRIGQTPEVNQTNTSTRTTFSIATNKRYKNKQGEMETVTTWHNVIFWRDLSFLKKGDTVTMHGEISYNKHDDKTYTNIVGQNITIVHRKKESESGSPATTTQASSGDENPFGDF